MTYNHQALIHSIDSLAEEINSNFQELPRPTQVLLIKLGKRLAAVRKNAQSNNSTKHK